MFKILEEKLLSFTDQVPLEWFVFIASFVEEVIAPIPSPTVMVVSGSLAHAQEYAYIGLFLLVVIGTIGKTLGAIVVYAIADKAEGIIVTLFGNYLRVSSEEIESFGQKLGKGKRDYLLLTFLRALPIMPSVVISAGSGVLKVPMKLFIFSTIFGTIVRDGFYLLAGYLGLELFSQIISGSAKIETLIEVAVVLIIFGYLAYKRIKNNTI